MKKDFQKWHGIKKELHERSSGVFFHEREIWWCSLGANIGFEQDGAGEDFQRPVIILKKFNLDVCLVIPLTGREKIGKYYFTIGEVDGKKATAVISQVRFIDRKRLVNKIGVVEEETFGRLMQAIVAANFNIK